MLTINDIVSYHIDNPNVKLAIYTDKISDLDILSKTNSTIIKASSIYEKNSIKSRPDTAARRSARETCRAGRRSP